MNDGKDENIIALIAPPWWLIPSKNTVTATEHLIEDYAFNLKKKGYKSVILARARDKTDLKDIQDINNYKNKYKYIKVSLIDRKLFGNRNFIIFYFLYILKLSFWIKQQKIKRIIVFQTLPFCFWIKIFNRKCKILYYIVNHELAMNKEYFKYPYISTKVANKVLPKVDCIVTMSDYIKSGIVERFPFVKNKCKTVYPGIDPDVFRSKDKDEKGRVIMYSGRIVPEKGIGLLVNAFKNLKKSFKDIQLYIVGAAIGPNVPKNYMDSFNEDGIKIFGLLSRKEVSELLREASIFVYPVIWEEPFGLAPIEAMAVGVPTVVSDNKSGYSEIINDTNGCYFKSEKQEDLEKVLRILLSSAGLRKEIGSNARDTVKTKLSWGNCIENTIECFAYN